MSLAKTLPLPLVENLPFINTSFQDAMVKAEDEAHGMDPESWPGIIGDDLVETIKSVETNTLTALLTALRPVVNKSLILSGKDLEVAAIENGSSYREYFVEDGDFDDFTDEQLQVWLLKSCAYPKDIDWRVVVSIYNESSPDQQKALDSFFWEFRRLDLESLTRTAGRVLKVPESLYSNDTRSLDGKDQVFCKIAGEWMPDDKFHTQFSVTYIDGLANAVTVIGYAGTCEQAIAKATVFTRSNDGSLDVKTQIQKDGTTKVVSPIAGKRVAGTISISLGNARIADADLERSVEIDSNLYASAGCKLTWGERKAGPLSEQQFRKALWSTEKLLGVRWSKVHHLENDLGM